MSLDKDMRQFQEDNRISIKETIAIVCEVEKWFVDAVNGIKHASLEATVFKVVQVANKHRDEMLAHYKKQAEDAIDVKT